METAPQLTELMTAEEAAIYESFVMRVSSQLTASWVAVAWRVVGAQHPNTGDVDA